MATRLGKYRLVKQIAQGGMAEVFLAMQQGPAGFEQEVVVKRILPDRASEPHFVEMFLAEARVAAAMSHPNIVQIVELGEHEGTYFIAMEAVRGVSVGQLIQRMAGFGLRVPPSFAARIVSDVCAGLSYAHRFYVGPEQRGVLHRDVSPDNVLVSYNGAVKIIDFGLARAVDDERQTGKNAVQGKMRYISPERAEGMPVDARSDLFGLAIVLYELLAGVHPFGAAKGLAAATANARNDPRPIRELLPELSKTMERVLEMGLQREPEARYESADAMRRDLENFLRSGGPYVGDAELGEFISSVVRGGENDLVWLRVVSDSVDDGASSSVRDAGKLGGVGVASGHLAPATDRRPRSVAPSGAPFARQTASRLAVMLGLFASVAVFAIWFGAGNPASVVDIRPPASTPEPMRASPAPTVRSGETQALPAKASPDVTVMASPSQDAGPAELASVAPIGSDASAATGAASDTTSEVPAAISAKVDTHVSTALATPKGATAEAVPSAVHDSSPRARARPLVGASMRGTGRLNITSNMVGARVNLDGRAVGTVPVSVAAVEGEHVVEVLMGDTVRRAVLNVAHDEVRAYAAEFGAGHLAIRRVPIGVVCSLDGKTLARTVWQAQWIRVVEGTHVVVCDDPAGEAHTETFKVLGDHRYTYTWPR